MEAERRQVTVLFTDMVGFTSFSELSGEEAAYSLMRDLSKLMDEAVRQQAGVVVNDLVKAREVGVVLRSPGESIRGGQHDAELAHGDKVIPIKRDTIKGVIGP